MVRDLVSGPSGQSRPIKWTYSIRVYWGIYCWLLGGGLESLDNLDSSIVLRYV